ncbi:MAG: VWA domain-containing protein [Acidobacteria bacterium]|nr:VWA domain-containing protein [Acidobacteriota bacterium]
MSGLRSFPETTARRSASIALAAGLLCLLVLQSPAALPNVPSQERQDLTKPLQYEVSVVLKLIQVYVTDKKGKPVEDLKLDDFTVTDNGRPVVLTDFEKHSLQSAPAEALKSEPVAENPAAPPPAALKTTRKFFLFFDFAYNNGRGIVKARTAALHFLDKELEPDDEVAILTYSMFKGVRVHEYLSRDHAKIREVVDSIGGKDIAGRASEIEQQYWLMAQEPLPGRGGGNDAQASLPQKVAEAGRQESKRIVQTFILRLTALAKALRYIPGQKQFILFSTGVPASLIYGSQAGNPSNLAGRAKFDVGDRVLRTQNEEMYKEFGAANCTFYCFDTRETAKGTDLFAYDALTFETGVRGLFGQQGVFQDSTDIFRDDKTTGLNALKRLTDITGGKYYSNINMYEKNLDQVQALTGTYYVVGYSVGEQEDGRFHEIKVAVKRPGCEVRAQAGYFNPKPYREFTPLEKELHLYDLALNERSLSRLPVSFPLTALAFGTVGTEGLEILAAIPGEVTAKFSGEKVEYVALIFDAKGDIRDVRRVETDPRPRRGQAVVFTSGTSLVPGDYTCRLVIRDMDTGLSAVSSARSVVRTAPAQGLRLGTPLLLRDETGCAYIDAGAAKGKVAIPWGEVYAFDKAVLAPVVGPVSKLTSRLVAVVPYSVAGADEPDVVLSGRLIDARSGQAIPVALTLIGRSWHSEAETVSLEFPLVGVAPGKYILYINAEDRASKTMASAQTSLVIKNAY